MHHISPRLVFQQRRIPVFERGEGLLEEVPAVSKCLNAPPNLVSERITTSREKNDESVACVLNTRQVFGMLESVRGYRGNVLTSFQNPTNWASDA